MGMIITLVASIGISYSYFVAFRALHGLVATAPQVVGVSIVNDMFFFHERARKVNLWVFTFLVGSYIGPFITSRVLPEMLWRFVMGWLAMFYFFSAIWVALLGKETLYNREDLCKPTAAASKLSVLIGIAGVKTKSQTNLIAESKYLGQLAIKPQLLLPSLYIMIVSAWSIGIFATITQLVDRPPFKFNDTKTSLMYLAPVIGTIVGGLWGHWFNDFIYNRYIRAHHGKYQPENRLGAIYLPCAMGIGGMVLYGQTLSTKELNGVFIYVAWALVAFSVTVSITAVSTYALDAFPHHTVLGSAWINFWRNIRGFYIIFFENQ